MSVVTETQLTPRPERACRLIQWVPWPPANPSLIGHCSVNFAGGWQLRRGGRA